MSFKLTALLGNRYHVSGTDTLGVSGSTVVDGKQWNDIKAYNASKENDDAFTEAVNTFFAPLLEAVEKVEQSAVEDSIGTIVLDEGTEHTHGAPANVVTLTRDSIVLRLIEEGDTDRLLWIGDSLEITEVVGQQPLPLEGGTLLVSNNED